MKTRKTSDWKMYLILQLWNMAPAMATVAIAAGLMLMLVFGTDRYADQIEHQSTVTTKGDR